MLPRPQPRFPEPDSLPFWEATRDRELRFQRCDDCEEVIFYPRAHCPSCGSGRQHWERSTGLGAIYTYTVVRQTQSKAFVERVPYVVAYVDLDEDFRMLTNIVDVEDLAALRCGARVELEWEEQGEDRFPVPVFTLASGSSEDAAQ